MNPDIDYGLAKPVDPNNVNYYVDNVRFYNEMKEYRAIALAAIERGEQQPVIPRYIGECFMKIAAGVAMKHNFRNYSFLDDMQSHAVENCVRKVLKFDPEVSTNPFSYYTQSVWYSFLDIIMREKKESKKKKKTMLSMDWDSFDLQDHDETGEFQMNLAEYIGSLGGDDDIDFSPKVKKKNETIGTIDCLFESEDEE